MIEHVIFPALRMDFIPTRKMAEDGSILQIADLHDLYKVFERCWFISLQQTMAFVILNISSQSLRAIVHRSLHLYTHHLIQYSDSMAMSQTPFLCVERGLAMRDYHMSWLSTHNMLLDTKNQ